MPRKRKTRRARKSRTRRNSVPIDPGQVPPSTGPQGTAPFPGLGYLTPFYAMTEIEILEQIPDNWADDIPKAEIKS
ncbi:MAG: hypothetical protein GY832_37715 [Chloroflexi bacterium]|nr:hypothetical protein [Chloroflexota bacterium]